MDHMWKLNNIFHLEPFAYEVQFANPLKIPLNLLHLSLLWEFLSDKDPDNAITNRVSINLFVFIYFAKCKYLVTCIVYILYMCFIDKRGTILWNMLPICSTLSWRGKLSIALECRFLVFKCRLGYGKLKTIETIEEYISKNCKNHKTYQLFGKCLQSVAFPWILCKQNIFRHQ